MQKGILTKSDQMRGSKWVKGEFININKAVSDVKIIVWSNWL